nr:hypothetical protein [Candidatus Koribacter versatilis]
MNECFLRCQSLALAFDLGFGVLFVLLERCGDLRDNVVGDVNVFEQSPEFVGNLLFPETRKVALAPTATAPVVDVFVFLELCRHGAVVVSASEHPTKRDIDLAIFAFVKTTNHRLYALE